MKTKEKMLKVIYDKIANKTLSFGCIIILDWNIINKKNNYDSKNHSD